MDERLEDVVYFGGMWPEKRWFYMCVSPCVIASCISRSEYSRTCGILYSPSVTRSMRWTLWNCRDNSPSSPYVWPFQSFHWQQVQWQLVCRFQAGISDQSWCHKHNIWTRKTVSEVNSFQWWVLLQKVGVCTYMFLQNGPLSWKALVAPWTSVLWPSDAPQPDSFCVVLKTLRNCLLTFRNTDPSALEAGKTNITTFDVETKFIRTLLRLWGSWKRFTTYIGNTRDQKKYDRSLLRSSRHLLCFSDLTSARALANDGLKEYWKTVQVHPSIFGSYPSQPMWSNFTVSRHHVNISAPNPAQNRHWIRSSGAPKHCHSGYLLLLWQWLRKGKYDSSL